MKYLICQDWINTTNNHTGMKHMCILLKNKYPDQYRIHIFKDNYKIIREKNIFVKLKKQFIRRIYNRFIPIYYAISLVPKLKRGDKIFLIEYLGLLTYHNYIAYIIKLFKPYINIAGLIHLTPQVFDTAPHQMDIQKWSYYVDKIMTLGSSLSNYLVTKEIPKEKISTLFHYVDLSYYKPEKIVENVKRINIIAMGNQKRNYNILQNIVKDMPEMDFIICQGVQNLSNMFCSYKNVNLVGFIEEDELKAHMNKADISLNIMDDTVGSNVIVTSLAMGLAMIVSDVGSIGDYCDETNTIFCLNEDINSFKNAIIELVKDIERLETMKQCSQKKAFTLNIEKINYLLEKVI